MSETQIEVITLEQQFREFSKMADPKLQDGTTIDLVSADYWMRQAEVLDDRTVTTTDTGLAFFNKSAITYKEFEEYLKDLAEAKNINMDDILYALCTCGLPGTVHVKIPQYRDYFDTWQPKNRLLNISVDESKY